MVARVWPSRLHPPERRRRGAARLAAVACALALCMAPSARAERIDHAIVCNPVTTLAGIVGATLGLPAAALDLRYHQQLDPRWGVTVALDAASVPVFLRYDLVVAKAGPRVSLSRPGLAGWHALPLLLAGWGWTHNSHGKQLASSAIVGLGAEAGYTWTFGALVLEVGAGLQSWRLLSGGDSAFSQALPPLRPVLNASIGYGW